MRLSLKVDKKALFYSVGAIIFAILLVWVDISANRPTVAYLQSSSLKTQLPPKANTMMLIKTESIDEKLNVSVSKHYDEILIKNDGVYFIMAAVQVGATSNKPGWVDLWTNLNDEQMSNSNTRQYIGSANDTTVLVSQSVHSLRTGDVVSIGLAVSDPTLGAIYTQPDNEPAIPSIIFTIIKISDL